jgi:hypothetical protein
MRAEYKQTATREYTERSPDSTDVRVSAPYINRLDRGRERARETEISRGRENRSSWSRMNETGVLNESDILYRQ